MLIDDPAPFGFAILEIDQQAHTVAGASQVIEALGHVLPGQTLSALQLYNQHVFDENVDKVLANRSAEE